MNVLQLMTRNVEFCRAQDTAAHAANLMWNHDVGWMPVLDNEGQVVGTITDRDICMAALTQGRSLDAIGVASAMSREVFSCTEADSLLHAEEVMRTHRVRRLPVLGPNGGLGGVITLNDLAREADQQQGRKGKEVTGQEVAVTLAAIGQPRQTKDLVQPRPATW